MGEPVLKAKRAYDPKKGGGGYAILIGMYFESIREGGRTTHTKSEICKFCQKWAAEPLLITTGKYAGKDRGGVPKYDGWSSVNATLKPKGLIDRINKAPKQSIPETLWCLTDTGELLARQLVEKGNLKDSGPELLPLAQPQTNESVVPVKPNNKVQPSVKSSPAKSKQKRDAYQCDIDDNAQNNNSLRARLEQQNCKAALSSSSSSSSSNTQQMWQCQRCTFDNSALNTECEVCLCERRDIGSSSSSDVGIRRKRDNSTADFNSEIIKLDNINAGFADFNSEKEEVLNRGSENIANTETTKSMKKQRRSDANTESSVMTTNLLREGIELSTFTGRPQITVISNTFELYKKQRMTWSEFSVLPYWISDINNMDETRVFTDEFDIVLKYDHNEKKSLGVHFDNLKDQYIAQVAKYSVNMTVEKCDLKVGDFMWVARHKHTQNELILDYIAERKTYGDLWGSITSSDAGQRARYYDQCIRMYISGIGNRFYIIEGGYDSLLGGKIAKSKEDIDKKMKSVKSTLVGAEFDGMLILESKDTKETVIKLLSITRHLCLSQSWGKMKLNEWIKSKYKKVPFCEFQTRNTVSRTKTIEELFMNSLYQLPTFGEKTVYSIIKKFPTLHSLFNKLDEVRVNALHSTDSDTVADLEQIRSDQISMLRREIGSIMTDSKAKLLCKIFQETF